MVKEFTKFSRSENGEYYLCAFDIMADGITPVTQFIDNFICKFFKGHY